MADQLPAINARRLIEDQTTVGRGRVFVDLKSLKTVNVTVRGTGTVSATVNLLGSNLQDLDAYTVIATFALTGNNFALDSAIIDAPWAYTQAEVTAIAGTGATVNVALGV